MQFRLPILTTALGAILLLTGCNNNNPAPEQYVPASTNAPLPSTPAPSSAPVIEPSLKARSPLVPATSADGRRAQVSSKKKSIGLVPKSSPASFTEAFNKYNSSGAFFQFVGCHGNPGLMTIKKGTKFMLDNRDPQAHTLAIGQKNSYHVSAYGFAIATAPVAGQFDITCDGGGAAHLNVGD